MKMNGRKRLGVVVESYDYDKDHQVVVVRSQDIQTYHFFFLSRKPVINFGDIIQMNFADEKFYIRRGNSKLLFKLTSLDFPGSLLWESMIDRMND